MGPTRNPPPSGDMGIEMDEIEGKSQDGEESEWPIEKGEAMNLWANSSQDGEDDTRIITDINLRKTGILILRSGALHLQLKSLIIETVWLQRTCKVVHLSAPHQPSDGRNPKATTGLRGGKLCLLTGNTDGKVSLNNMMNNLFRDHNLNKPVYHDLVKYKDKWFSIDQYGRGVMVDSSSKLSLVTNALFHLMWNGYYRNHKSYLVKSSGDADLYLVDRYMVKSSERTNYAAQHAATSGDDTKGPVYDMAVKFKVYKLEEEEQCWKEATSLNDLVIFVGEDASFLSYCVSAKDFPRCRGNMIYFTDKFRRFMGCAIT
ncbi:hypothetical protein CQW23_30876 [Capsicum baccatum]|uniref:KIB1-4 beta-propeller domain-containing protein n=1 Tax=Capsicum baccatum TaxID=33114 RepID=A0A2G2V980_CAPBA|nr:hypothetical protein CQW23_30876 [Capsicum baccatum]